MNPSTNLFLDEMRRLFTEQNAWLDRRFAEQNASIAPTPAPSATAASVMTASAPSTAASVKSAAAPPATTSVVTAAAPSTAACVTPAPAPAPSASATTALFDCAWSESHDSLYVAANRNGSVRLYNADATPEPELEAAASVERSAQVPLATAAMVGRGEPYGSWSVSSYGSCAAWSIRSLTRHRPASPSPISISFPDGSALDVLYPSRSHSPSSITQTFVADLNLSVTLVESLFLRTHLVLSCSYVTVTTQRTRPPSSTPPEVGDATPTVSRLGDAALMVSAADLGKPAVLTFDASKVLDEMWSHVVSEAEDKVPSTLPNRPWPPPTDHWLVNCEAGQRPLPWLSFNMVARYSVKCFSGHLWKHPWYVSIRQLMCVLAELGESWGYLVTPGRLVVRLPLGISLLNPEVMNASVLSDLQIVHHGRCCDRGVSSLHIIVHQSIAYQPWRSDQIVICWISGATKTYLAMSVHWARVGTVCSPCCDDVVDFGKSDDAKPKKLEALVTAVHSGGFSPIIHSPAGGVLVVIIFSSLILSEDRDLETMLISGGLVILLGVGMVVQLEACNKQNMLTSSSNENFPFQWSIIAGLLTLQLIWYITSTCCIELQPWPPPLQPSFSNCLATAGVSGLHCFEVCLPSCWCLTQCMSMAFLPVRWSAQMLVVSGVTCLSISLHAQQERALSVPILRLLIALDNYNIHILSLSWKCFSAVKQVVGFHWWICDSVLHEDEITVCVIFQGSLTSGFTDDEKTVQYITIPTHHLMQSETEASWLICINLQNLLCGPGNHLTSFQMVLAWAWGRLISICLAHVYLFRLVPWDPGGSQFLLSASMAVCALIQKASTAKVWWFNLFSTMAATCTRSVVPMQSFNDISAVLLTQRLHQHSVLQQLDNCTISHQHVHLSSSNGKLLVGGVDGPIDARYIICFSVDAMVVGDIPSDQLSKHPWPPPGLLHLTHTGIDLWALQWLLQLQFYHLLVEDP